MHLENIGRIIQHRRYWHLVYDQCGHAQQFARAGLEQLEQAAREVQQYYAECLTCRLGNRRVDPVIYPADPSEPTDPPLRNVAPRRRNK